MDVRLKNINKMRLILFLLLFFSVYDSFGLKINKRIIKSKNYLFDLVTNENTQTDKKNSLAYPNRILFSSLIKYNPKYFKHDTLDLLQNYKPVYDDDISIYPYYNRLIDKNFSVNKDSLRHYLDTHYDIDMAMMWAIYADMNTFDYKINAVNRVLESYSYDSTQIRAITHCALVIKWVTALGMKYKIENIEKIEDTYIKYSLEYLNNNPVWTDTGMEAILTLFLLNRKDLVKKKWIKEVITQQKLDGGWFYDDNSNTTNQHPTLLALWILLEYEK